MIGPCVYLTCDSVIGSSFRSTFWDQSGYTTLLEVLLCPTHTRLFESVRAKDGPMQFMVTPDGWVYLRMWLDAMGFLSA